VLKFQSHDEKCFQKCAESRRFLQDITTTTLKTKMLINEYCDQWKSKLQFDPATLGVTVVLMLAGLGYAGSEGAPLPMKIPESSDGTAAGGAEFILHQPWAKEAQPELRPAVVHLAWTPAKLIVEARLTDDEIFSSATQDNERLWELGDVLEIFAMVEGRREYVELHVAPNGRRMHLRIPGVGGRATPDAEPTPFEEMFVTPVGFTGEAMQGPRGWRVKAHIPAEVFGLATFAEGQRFRVSFCRYDASSQGEPVLSTSSPHPVVAFHRPEDWTRIVLAK
jgi:hypothetical protein